MLHIFVGGDPADVARARPVLEAMGDPERIVHVGPGAPATPSSCLNLQWFVHAAAAAEALVMGARAGLDLGPSTGRSRRARALLLPRARHRAVFEGDYGERFRSGSSPRT